MKPTLANEHKQLSSVAWLEMQDEIETHAERMLKALGIDIVNDPNTQGTARRMAKMLVFEVCSGRHMPEPKFTVFPNTKKLDELIMTGPLQVRSLCSHHFCPIIGQAWVGVIPRDYLAGLSKFSRVLDWFASRPQMQEELTSQVAHYLFDKLNPAGVAIVIKANHTCMTWRGVKECPQALMTTSTMLGVFRSSPEARAEFLSLMRG